MEKSLPAAMVSWITETQLLGGRSLGRAWQAYGNRQKGRKGWDFPPENSIEVMSCKTLENTFLKNRIHIFIMDIFAE